MRALILAVPVLVAGLSLAHAANTPSAGEINVCMKAAAAADHVKLEDVDKDACICATKQLRLTLRPDDYDLHEKMLTVIGSGADQKSFDKQMSDIMLKRSMNQQDVNAFLARSKKAETAAQAKCNTAPPLLGPTPLLGPMPASPH